ncbi:hypothetical protein [Streptococcus iniae]|nr:hypothetical protein [Streptococcus iniae]
MLYRKVLPFHSFTYGKDIASILGIEEITAEDVCQSPKLLKDKI